MKGEIIEVCQDCGHVIDPVRVRHGTAIYEIRMCQRDECLFDRMQVEWLAELRKESARRSAYPMHTDWLHVPSTTDIGSAFRITGY